MPLTPDSPLLETVNLVAVSLLADTVALSLFALGRLWRPSAFFDLQRFLMDPSGFLVERPGLTLRTAIGLLLVAIAVAWLLAARPGPLARLVPWFAPTLLDVPAWYHVFEASQEEYLDEPNYVHIGCTLKSGGYISGILAWYSTDTAETDDRNVVLAPPLLRENAEGKAVDMTGVGRVILSAREIAVMEVTFVASLDWAESP